MPPPIPETCGVMTCNHDKANYLCYACAGPNIYRCQEIKGKCEIHDKKPERTTLPTDDVLTLVTQQRDRAVRLLKSGLRNYKPGLRGLTEWENGVWVHKVVVFLEEVNDENRPDSGR